MIYWGSLIDNQNKTMKSLPCDFCDAKIDGENFDQWMEAAHAHYGSNHAEKLEGISEEDKAKWVEASKAKFEAA